MVATVEKLLSMDVEAVISGLASIDLLRCYSVLYLNGAAPATCGAKQREYFDEIRKTGLDKAKKYIMAKERTCKPKNNGILIIRNYGTILASEMTDDVALYLLKNGLLTPSDFEVMPNPSNSGCVKQVDSDGTEKPKRTRKQVNKIK